MNCRFVNADGYTDTGTGFLGYNMFAYCNNHPVTYQDERGQSLRPTTIFINDSGSCDREINPELEDITSLLNEMMETHSQEFADYIANSYKHYTRYLDDKIALSFTAVDAAQYFRSMVTDGAPWDIKLKSEYFDLTKKYLYKGIVISAEDAGNIHAGYVGAVFFSDEILHIGAGINQIKKGIVLRYVWYFFDEPRDYYMVQYGIRCYKGGKQ